MKKEKTSNFNKLMLIPIRDTDMEYENRPSEAPIIDFSFGEVKMDLGGNTMWGTKLKTSGAIFYKKEDRIENRFSEDDCVFISKTIQRVFDQLIDCIDTKNIDIVDLHQPKN